MKRKGLITGINGNMITADFDGELRQSEVAYVIKGEKRLKAEVVRIREGRADLQLFESAKGLKAGDGIEFSGELLSIELGPGLLGSLYDGLQTPLNEMAAQAGAFLEGGRAFSPLSRETSWHFTPAVKKGDIVNAGDTLGTVPEGIFTHRIMVPFHLDGDYEVKRIANEGDYTLDDEAALLEGPLGEVSVKLSFRWPVKRAIRAYSERIAAREPLESRIRIIDTLFPIAKGGAYCIPGPFGAGKTVLQQIMSRNATMDVVVIAACGERAGEVVETIREFPKLIDRETGRSLMERTIIVCNTSSMPVAARESSVYTAITMAEYYRQMGLDVLLLADSTSRWAQAMRERSGRLEEIPGEEAFPAYLESVIADFYERAGMVRLNDGKTGSVTIGGTISPAGGYFEEPVTQATLKVVGAFQGLSRERSDARRFPAIDPLQSWSRYPGILDTKDRDWILEFMNKASEIEQMMKVVGEEGTSVNDYVIYLKSELFDSVYLQQNAFDVVDAASSTERQLYLFKLLSNLMKLRLELKEKEEAKGLFFRFRQMLLDLNGKEWKSEDFNILEKGILDLAEQHKAVDEGESPDLKKAFIEVRAEDKLWRPKKRKSAINNQREKETEEEDEEGLQQDS